MTIQLTPKPSPTAQELLRAGAGRGVSSDPALLSRPAVRLLQNVSKLPKHGRGAPDLWLLPDEAQTCVEKLRIVLGALYPVFIERSADGKPADEHHVLPPEAEKDGYFWRLPGGYTIDRETRIAGIFNNNVEAELGLAKTGMKVARALNADASARTKKIGVPLCALAYELGSQELVNDRGQTYFGATFSFLGAAGEPDGPSDEEIVRASALCDLVENAIDEAKREAAAALLVGDHRRIGIMPPHKPAFAPTPRPVVTSGREAWARPEAPPPVEIYDGPEIDDDVPF